MKNTYMKQNLEQHSANQTNKMKQQCFVIDLILQKISTPILLLRLGKILRFFLQIK